MRKLSHIKSSVILTGIFLILWAALAFNVHDRTAWLLENALVFIFMGPSLYLFMHHKMRTTGYICLLVFLIFHTIGAHYTYSKVPYNEWTSSLFGFSLNDTFGWTRNHYDRWVHFLWGLLLYKPLRDVFGYYTKLKNAWQIVFALLLIMATSSVYELIEWAVAEIMGDGVGPTYIGTQGDVWDAQKDQALAILGSFIAAALFYFVKERPLGRGRR